LTDEFDFEFKDVDFEKMAKLDASSYRAEDLIKMSRKVDRFGNKMHGEGCYVMIGIVTPDDYFKFYSNINPLRGATIEMLARLILKTCEERKIAKDLDELPINDVLQAIKYEVEVRG
jgi:hypothetical protein